jgi:hypothetical protein
MIGVNRAIDAQTEIFFADTIEEIKKTPSGSLIVLEFQEQDLEFYANADIEIAAILTNSRDFILCAATKIRYAVAHIALAIELQKLADRYLYDIKILAIAPSNAIEKIASLGIDGIFALDLDAISAKQSRA